MSLIVGDADLEAVEFREILQVGCCAVVTTPGPGCTSVDRLPDGPVVTDVAVVIVTAVSGHHCHPKVISRVDDYRAYDLVAEVGLTEVSPNRTAINALHDSREI